MAPIPMTLSDLDYNMFIHESESARSLQLQSVLSKLKNFSRSETLMYTIKVVLCRKRCKIEALLLNAT